MSPPFQAPHWENAYDEMMNSLKEEREKVQPSVYDYSDFRTYLKDSFEYRRWKNSSYSETAFMKQAGFGKNSRGYFSLLVKGKRNLSAKSILGFVQALKLKEREAQFFENLVLYNQAQNDKDKCFYFGRMEKMVKGRESKAFQLLKSQYNYFSNWYLVAIRELVAFDDFEESEDWIRRQLRGRVTKKEIRNGIEDLLKLGLLKRDESGCLIQVDELVRFSDSTMNYTVVNNLHRDFLTLYSKSLEEDRYEDRSVSGLLLACDANSFEDIREEIREFREKILKKYGSKPKKVDSLLSVGLQLNFLTPPEESYKRRER